MSNIYLSSPDGTQSQHNDYQLHSMWEQGLLHEDALYWKEGMSEWRAISEYFQPNLSSNVSPPTINQSIFSYAKDPRQLTSFLIIMLWVSAGSEIVSMLSDIAQLGLLNKQYSEVEAAGNDTRQGLIGLVYVTIFIVTGITFLKWIYRANKNCRSFGDQYMEFTPGWSVGYYFIPFLNLVKPYQSMREIWQVSQDPSNPKSVNVGSLLGWWWALWIISNVLGQFVYRTSINAQTIDELQLSTGLSISASFIGIPLCLIAMKLVKKISGLQEETVKRG